jgi:hypothetical protein
MLSRNEIRVGLLQKQMSISNNPQLRTVNCKEVVYLELSTSTLWSLLSVTLLLIVNLIFLITTWEKFPSQLGVWQ